MTGQVVAAAVLAAAIVAGAPWLLLRDLRRAHRRAVERALARLVRPVVIYFNRDSGPQGAHGFRVAITEHGISRRIGVSRRMAPGTLRER